MFNRVRRPRPTGSKLSQRGAVSGQRDQHAGSPRCLRPRWKKRPMRFRTRRFAPNPARPTADHPAQSRLPQTEAMRRRPARRRRTRPSRPSRRKRTRRPRRLSRYPQNHRLRRRHRNPLQRQSQRQTQPLNQLPIPNRRLISATGWDTRNPMDRARGLPTILRRRIAGTIPSSPAQTPSTWSGISARGWICIKQTA